MPAEAIHLSALTDSIEGSTARAVLSRAEVRAAARLGAVFVDLPYFDRFPIAVMRYLLKRPVTVSRWGDTFHHRAPVAFGKAILREASALLAAPTTRAAGERLLGFGLGYFSHVAVDTSVHPSVNRIAQARAERLRDSPQRQHNEVEKFQSIIFHHERHGFDFMGHPFLRGFIAVDEETLLGDPETQAALSRALSSALGEAPPLALLRRWARGYRQYGALISSPFGRQVAPEALKQEARPEVYEGPDGPFLHRFAVAVSRSRRYLDAALAFAQHSLPETELDLITPEGSLDHPPFPSESFY